MDERDRKIMFMKTFDTVAGGYDSASLRFIPESAKHIPSCLRLKGNEHVLDVATGTGNVALELAGHLPEGRVTGIDFSRGMLDQAARKVKTLNIGNIDLKEMDMQEIDFPDNYFDAAVSAFSIFFIADMEKQLSHIASKVKPGGKIVITNFFENCFSPLVALFLNRLEQYNIEIPPLTWKRIASEEKCVELFRGAHLKDVRCEKRESGYYLKDASDWWEIIWNGGFRGLVNQLSEDDMKKFRDEHSMEVRQHSSEKGIWLEMNILFTVGTKSWLD